jgi:DNA-binding beta-propeller fold protein YncE
MSPDGTSILRHVDDEGAITTVQTLDQHEGPAGAALDAAETYLYFSVPAENQLERINLHDPKDVVVIAAQGAGAPDTINQPQGLVVDDAAGAIYWADQGGHRIQRLALADRSVTTVVGGLDKPVDVVLDGKGHLLVAESTAVKEISLADGSARTIAQGFQRIAQISYDPAGVVYVADAGDPRVRGVVVATGATFDLAGTSGRFGVALGALPARLNYPAGVAVLPNGDVAISDKTESVILAARLVP